MSNISSIKQAGYFLFIIALGGVLFLFMTQGTFVNNTYSQTAADSVNTLADSFTSTQDDAAAIADCEFKGGRWELLNSETSEYYCRQTETEAETDARIAEIDARREELYIERDDCRLNGGVREGLTGTEFTCRYNDIEADISNAEQCELDGGVWRQSWDSSFDCIFYDTEEQTKSAKRSEANIQRQIVKNNERTFQILRDTEGSFFNESAKLAELCNQKEDQIGTGIFNCNGNDLFIYNKETRNEFYGLTVDEAARVYNETLHARDTCRIVPNSASYGCNLNSATNFECSGVPNYEIASLNRGRLIAAYIPYPLPEVQSTEEVIEVAEPEEDPEVVSINDALQEEEEKKNLPVFSASHAIKQPTLAAVCIEAGATTDRQCATLLDQDAIPEVCRDNQIYTLEGCKRFMLSRNVDDAERQGAETVITDGLPNKCERLGITDVINCNKVIAESAIHDECKEIDITTSDECNQFLEDKYKDQISSSCEPGISDADCLEKAVTKFSNNTICLGLPRETCDDVLREQHFGSWLADKDEIEKNHAVAKNLSGAAVLSIERLDQEEQDFIAKTITNDRPIYIYPAIGSVVVTKENELDFVPPALIILDDDGDGLSNELEERIGTNPDRRDTDDDGFDDRMELQNGFDPLGDGEKVYGFWPIDGAMVYELPLDQPLLSEAVIDDELIIESIVNKSTDTKPLHILSGKGPANTLLTLYLYSTLPIVLTVQTDKNGNWEYTLEESLADGEHEVFITLVDTFGTITKKSPAFTFFIQEAQAIEADEFFGFESITVSPNAEPVNQFSRYYLYAAATLVAFALVIAIFFIWNRKSSEELFPEMTDDDIPHV